MTFSPFLLSRICHMTIIITICQFLFFFFSFFVCRVCLLLKTVGKCSYFFSGLPCHSKWTHDLGFTHQMCLHWNGALERSRGTTLDVHVARRFSSNRSNGEGSSSSSPDQFCGLYTWKFCTMPHCSKPGSPTYLCRYPYILSINFFLLKLTRVAYCY